MVDPIKESRLTSEVSAIVEDAIEAGRVAPASWLTQEVVSSWDSLAESQGHGGHYILCAYEHVRAVVRKVVQRYKTTEDETDLQLLLPGNERLQKAYLINRDSEQSVVPIDQMSASEIDAKATELRAMAAGCLKHAEELERYRDERFSAATG